MQSMESLFALARSNLAPNDSPKLAAQWLLMVRVVIRDDMECPSCFILGAELVQESASTQGTKRIMRQACFRCRAISASRL